MSATRSNLEQIGSLIDNVQTCEPSASSTEANFRYVDLSSVDQDAKKITGDRVVPVLEAPSRARQRIHTGDILVSTVRPNLNAVAVVPERLNEAIASTGFCVLRPKRDLLCGRYLFHWVRTESFISEMVRRATGASYPAISDRIIFESTLPLPPLEDQRRIAGILDRADSLRQTHKKAVGLLRVLETSAFYARFGSPNEWDPEKLIPLESICTQITDGTHKTPTYVAQGIPFVTVSNIVSGTLDLLNTKFITQQEHESLTRRTRPEIGDILVSKDGTIGVPCPVFTDSEFSIFVSVALLKLRKDLVDPIFLTAQIRLDWIQEQITAGTKGIAIRHLHLEDFKRLRVYLPTLNDQTRFAKGIKAVQAASKKMSKFGAKLDSLFSCLQQRAFRGKL